MRTPQSVHGRVLISILAAGVTLGAACGGSKPPGTTDPGEPAEDTVIAPGTTGLPGLDWQASADDVLALYPRGEESSAGITAIGTVDGHQAITLFSIGPGGLTHVEIEWTEGFISMDDCATGWHEIRAKVDARVGPSTADVLFAYWTTPTASLTLACHPNDSDAAVLSQTFSRRTAE